MNHEVAPCRVAGRWQSAIPGADAGPPGRMGSERPVDRRVGVGTLAFRWLAHQGGGSKEPIAAVDSLEFGACDQTSAQSLLIATAGLRLLQGSLIGVVGMHAHG